MADESFRHSDHSGGIVTGNDGKSRKGRDRDAAVLTEPTFSFAEDQGYRILADLANMEIYYLHSMVDSTRSYLRAHRDLALQFMKVYVEGIIFFKRNRSETIEILKKKMRTTPGQIKYLERSHALYSSAFSRTLRIRRSRGFVPCSSF